MISNPYIGWSVESLERIAKANGLQKTPIWDYYHKQKNVEAMAELLHFHFTVTHKPPIRLESIMAERNSSLVALLDQLGTIRQMLDQGKAVNLAWSGLVLRIDEVDPLIQPQTPIKSTRGRKPGVPKLPEPQSTPTTADTSAVVNEGEKVEIPPPNEPPKKPEKLVAGIKVEGLDKIPETLQEFDDVKKGLKYEQIIALAKAYGVEWTEHEDHTMNRIRAIVAIHNLLSNCS